MRLPFGLCIAGNRFQRYINRVFKDLMLEGTIAVYMDDFVFPSDDEVEGIKKLQRVLEVSTAYGLQINFKKRPIP